MIILHMLLDVCSNMPLASIGIVLISNIMLMVGLSLLRLTKPWQQICLNPQEHLSLLKDRT